METVTLIIEKIKENYARFEYISTPIIKFLLALIAINTVNSTMGYSEAALNGGVIMMVSLACSFLPIGAIPFSAAIYSLFHMYAISLVTLAIGLIVYIILFVLLFRLDSKYTFLAVVTPLLFAIKMQYLIPVVIGLVATPMAAVSVASGITAYYLLTTVISTADTMMNYETAEMLDSFKYLIDAFLANKVALSTSYVFAIVILIVFVIKRIPVKYNWAIAMSAGALCNILFMIIANAKNDLGISIANLIFVSILSVIIGLIIQLFVFYVDFDSVEKVQFEDDDYYYYVTAIPKVVSKSKKKKSSPHTAPAKPRPVRNAVPDKTTVMRRVNPAPVQRNDYYEEPTYEPLQGNTNIDYSDNNQSSTDDEFEDLF